MIALVCMFQTPASIVIEGKFEVNDIFLSGSCGTAVIALVCMFQTPASIVIEGKFEVNDIFLSGSCGTAVGGVGDAPEIPLRIHRRCLYGGTFEDPNVLRVRVNRQRGQAFLGDQDQRSRLWAIPTNCPPRLPSARCAQVEARDKPDFDGNWPARKGMACRYSEHTEQR